jgi:hypothetical protein
MQEWVCDSSDSSTAAPERIHSHRTVALRVIELPSSLSDHLISDLFYAISQFLKSILAAYRSLFPD